MNGADSAPGGSHNPARRGGLRAWARAFNPRQSDGHAGLAQRPERRLSERFPIKPEDEGTIADTEHSNRGWDPAAIRVLSSSVAQPWFWRAGEIVAGYLYNPDRSSVGPTGMSNPCWAKSMCLARAGITLSPQTAVSAPHLIPVAVARDLGSRRCRAGSFVGITDAFTVMWVEVISSHRIRHHHPPGSGSLARIPRAPAGGRHVRRERHYTFGLVKLTNYGAYIVFVYCPPIQNNYPPLISIWGFQSIIYCSRLERRPIVAY